MTDIRRYPAHVVRLVELLGEEYDRLDDEFDWPDELDPLMWWVHDLANEIKVFRGTHEWIPLSELPGPNYEIVRPI